MSSFARPQRRLQSRPRPRVVPSAPASSNRASGNGQLFSETDAGQGHALPPYLRTYFEHRFGEPLGEVALHHDTSASSLATEGEALAFTHGSHVVLDSSAYAPERARGRQVLAHELAHVLQQRGTGSSSSPQALEREAGLATVSATAHRQPIPIQERAPLSLQRLPRSLSSSVDPSLASPQELQREVEEIHHWLWQHQEESSPERELLLSVLPNLELYLPSGATPEQDAFSEAFNREFRSILHVFATQPETLRRQRGRGEVGEASGGELSSFTLNHLFTAVQRAKLMEFIRTRHIPERLFTGDDVGPGTPQPTAQQRLLIASHILASGTYRPGPADIEQGVHARMCWHWAQTAHHYAGVTPSGGPVTQGVMGSFDPFGNALLGGGSMGTVYQGSRVMAADLPESEGGGLGPIPAGSSHAEAVYAEDLRRATHPEAGPRVHRRRGMELSSLSSTLRPGDWLWLYNANASAGGAHSVIFSRWASGPQSTEDGVAYRTAIVFSQVSPSRGGREHTALIGDRFHQSGRTTIVPVVHVSRVSPEAGPARRPEDLVPTAGPRRQRALARLDARNAAFLRRLERRRRGSISQERLRAWLRAQNRRAIRQLAGCLSGVILISPEDQQPESPEPAESSPLSAGQYRLLLEANDSTDLRVLVALNQRLHALTLNAELLERNMAGQFDEVFLSRYRRERQQMEEARATAQAEMGRIAAEVSGLEAEITRIEGSGPMRADRERRALRRRLRQQLVLVWREMRPLPRGDERDALQELRMGLRTKIRLLAQSRDQRRELAPLERELRALRRQIRRLRVQRQRQEGRMERAQRDLPYSLLHPGRLSGQARGRVDGYLGHLPQPPDWPSLMTESPSP